MSLTSYQAAPPRDQGGDCMRWHGWLARGKMKNFSDVGIERARGEERMATRPAWVGSLDFSMTRASQVSSNCLALRTQGRKIAHSILYRASGISV